MLRYLHCYLPLLLFLGFLFPNTRFPINDFMLLGRWYFLFAILIFTLGFKADRKYHLGVDSLCTLLIISFFWIMITLFYSVNFTISFNKWAAFFSFLIFCMVYSSSISSKEDIVKSLYPLMLLFIVIIWTTPLGVIYYPQRIFIVLGAINGYFIYTNQLGHFLAVFGIPTALFLLSSKDKFSGKRWKFFLFLTLLLSVCLTIASKARAATTITIILLGIALWRSKKAKVLKLILFTLLSFYIIWGDLSLVNEYIHKYHTPEAVDNIMESRQKVWEETLDAFQKRELFGSGFGVQEQMDENSTLFLTTNFREQGSTIYGLLEEIGWIGAIPIFVCLICIAYRCSISILFSNNELEIFLSRVIITGLGLALFENFLLYLGNAVSILIFFALFMRDRLINLSNIKVNRSYIMRPLIYYQGNKYFMK